MDIGRLAARVVIGGLFVGTARRSCSVGSAGRG
jgi:hypothetical protein